MRTFIKKNYLHFIKNCIRPPYKKLKSLKSGLRENSNFENNRDPCLHVKYFLYIYSIGYILPILFSSDLIAS